MAGEVVEAAATEVGRTPVMVVGAMVYPVALSGVVATASAKVKAVPLAGQTTEPLGEREPPRLVLVARVGARLTAMSLSRPVLAEAPRMCSPSLVAARRSVLAMAG